jgi:iron complex transport system substrate-binding protein
MKTVKPDVRSLPSVGTGDRYQHGGALRLNPDVVITWTFRPEQISFMEKRGLKVIAVYPDSIAEMYGVLRIHGRLFGKEKIMNASIARMESMFNMIKSRVGKVPASGRRKVLWLGTRMTNVAGGIGLSGDTLAMIGAINPASHIRQRNVDVSVEK